MKRILVLNHHGIGDVLLTIPMIKTLKNHGFVISMTFASELEASLIKNMDLIDEYIYFNISNKKFFHKILYLTSFILKFRKKTFDFGLSTAGINSNYSLMLFNVLGIDNKSITKVSDKKIKHKVLINLEALNIFNIKENSYVLDMSIDLPNDINFNFPSKFGSDYCCIHPGSNENDKFKRINKKYLVEIFKFIPDKTFIITGTEKEKQIANDIYKIAKNMGINIYNACSKYNLIETSIIIKNSKFIIGGDSGMLHVANSLDIPTLAFFGPTSFDYTGPYGNSNYLLNSKNCNCNHPFYRDTECNCMEDFSISEIKQKLKLILKH